MRSRSERGARNSAIFWRQTTERHGMIPNLPGGLPLLRFFSQKVWAMSGAERRTLVDQADPVLSVAAQCRLLKIARSTLYYQPAPIDPDDLALMRRMDELDTASPFYGSRRMVVVRRRDGWSVNRKRVRR